MKCSFALCIQSINPRGLQAPCQKVYLASRHATSCHRAFAIAEDCSQFQFKEHLIIDKSIILASPKSRWLTALSDLFGRSFELCSGTTVDQWLIILVFLDLLPNRNMSVPQTPSFLLLDSTFWKYSLGWTVWSSVTPVHLAPHSTQRGSTFIQKSSSKICIGYVIQL